MNKRFLLIASLVCSAPMLDHAFPSPKQMLKTSWAAISACGKTSYQQVYKHKYALLLTSAVVAGGVVAYKSKKVQKLIKKLLKHVFPKPLKPRPVKPVTPVIPAQDQKKIEENSNLVVGNVAQTAASSEQIIVCPCESKEADHAVPTQATCGCEESSK